METELLLNYCEKRWNTRQALVPPNPKLLDITVFSLACSVHCREIGIPSASINAIFTKFGFFLNKFTRILSKSLLTTIEFTFLYVLIVIVFSYNYFMYSITNKLSLIKIIVKESF